MLHLISQSSIDLSLLQRIDSGDDVVFLENAVFCLNKGSLLSAELKVLLKNNVFLYVLSDELNTRGVSVDELVAGVEVIDYSGLVKLTEKNKLVKSWN